MTFRLKARMLCQWDYSFHSSILTGCHATLPRRGKRCVTSRKTATKETSEIKEIHESNFFNLRSWESCSALLLQIEYMRKFDFAVKKLVKNGWSSDLIFAHSWRVSHPLGGRFNCQSPLVAISFLPGKQRLSFGHNKLKITWKQQQAKPFV